MDNLAQAPTPTGAPGPHRRAAVIGSGFGGLAVAIRLQTAGFQTTLFEALDKPGGRAYVFEKEGYTFDGGPTVITAPHCLEELFSEAGKNIADYVELLPVAPFYRLVWDDGDQFDYVGDSDAMLEQIRQRNPDDADGYLKFVEYSRRVFDAGYTDLAHTPFLRFSDMEGGDALDAYVNTGTGDSIGVEGTLRARTDNFFGWIAYTLSRSERRDFPDSSRRLFDFDQTHNFIILGSYQLGKWRFGGRWQYTTGQPDTPIVGSTYLSDLNIYVPRFGPVNSDRIEDAHQLDIRIDREFEFDSWKLSAYLDVTNVYAHAQTLGYQYSFDFSEREAFETLPIFPALGVRGTF